MGKKKITAMKCDNPECRALVAPEDEFSEPQGIYLGRGHYTMEWGGGPLPALFACSTDCVGPAVEEALGRR